jgi:PAS domain S-box-containing protein
MPMNRFFRVLDPATIRRVNLAVTVAAMVLVPTIFAFYMHDSVQGIEDVAHTLPLPLIAMASIVFTSAFINYLNVTLSRNEEELKALHARKLYSDLFETAHDAIVICDIGGRIDSANPATTRLLGLPREKLVGNNLHGFVVGGVCTLPSDDAETREGVCILSMAKPGGGIIKVEAVTTSFFEGSAEKYMYFLRDVTEREVFQERRRILEKMATLGEMAAKISHEINNPLAAIHTFAELGARRAEEGKLKSYFEAIVNQSERITGITTTYLKFSRQSVPEPQDFDPRTAAEQALDILVMSGQGKHVRIAKEITDEPLVLRGHRDQLVQVFLNLMVNAAHATEKNDERTLGISLAREDGRLVARISDNGTGIPHELRERIFDPFFTTKEEGKGTGLGLPLVKEIVVDQYRGTIDIDSTPGEGTTFTVRIPLSA